MTNRVVRTVKGVHLSEKALDVINDESRYISLEGTTGSLKTITADRAFHRRVYNTDGNKTQFAIIGTTTPVLERTIIDNPLSFYNKHKYTVDSNGRKVQVMKYLKSGKGGSRIEWRTPKGIKRIYFAGFDNKARFKQILGMTLYGIWCDEIQTAHEDFIRELFTRLARDSGFLYTTSNAGLPDQRVYVDYLNKGRPSDKWANDVPHETMLELEKIEADRRYRFYWFGFTDNPIMTDDEIRDLYNTHPVGSFEYNSKILAIRGYVEGLLYAKLINDIYIGRNNEYGGNIRMRDINHHAFERLYVGIDLGSAAKTVFVITGVTRGYQRVVALDTKEMIGDFDYNDIVHEFNKWFIEYYSLYTSRIIGIYPDAADPLFIKTLRNNAVIKHIPIVSSIKATIKERVTLKEQLLHQGRLLFTDMQGSQKLKTMLSRVKTDGKGGHLDESTIEMDYNDAFDYSLTPVMHNLMSFKRRK